MDALAKALGETDTDAAVEGFPERLPAEQGASLCLHLQRLIISGQTWQVVEQPIVPAPPRPLSVNPKSNESRFPAFAEFLQDTFGGHAALSAGCGVMDVAGGSGGLAFELSVRRQVQCVVVDPRELRLTPEQRDVLDYRQTICKALARWVPVSPQAHSMHAKFQSRQVSQLQKLFDSRAILSGAAASEDVASAVRECSVIVGMHPDQALDHIVDVALALGKPFAVAPCCVFWKHGRNHLRRTPEGEVVKTYEQLCAYLAARAPGIRETALRFHGLNRVFYWLPSAIDEGARLAESDLYCQPCTL